MTEPRFDGRIAVITGGARGLGRAYADLLGSLGASVVINDNGSAIVGEGCDAGHAEQAVAAIRAICGKGVADSNSVATFEGGSAIIQTALDAFGKVDILIHSAGNVVRPAFPHMLKAGYRRVC